MKVPADSEKHMMHLRIEREPNRQHLVPMKTLERPKWQVLLQNPPQKRTTPTESLLLKGDLINRI